MFRDKYTNFWFNDISSSSLNVWMTNNHDLKNNLTPSFTDKFNNPTYSQTRFYEGTTITAQDLSISCTAINITRADWRAIAEWLSPLATGKLVFDWNLSHYYMVKISKQISNTIWVKSSGSDFFNDRYIVTFDLQFTTVGDWAALSQPAVIGIDANDTSCNALERFKNEYYIPSFIMSYYQPTVTGTGNTALIHNNATVTFTVPTKDTIYYLNGDIYAQIEYDKDDNKIIVTYADRPEVPISYPSTNIFTFKGAGEFIYYCSIDGNTVRNNNTLQFCVSNCGTYDMYLKFYGQSNSLQISKNNKNLQLCNLQLESSMPVEIDCHNGLITSLGQLYSGSKGQIVPFDIKSGRPEFQKAYLVEATELKSGTSQNLGVWDLKLLLQNPLIYGRDKNFIIHIFQEKPADLSAKFESGNYGWDTTGDNYLADDWNTNHVIMLNPTITLKSDKTGIYYHLYIKENLYFNNAEQLYGNTIAVDGACRFKTKQYLYIAICDTDIYDIAGEFTLDAIVQNRDMM